MSIGGPHEVLPSHGHAWTLNGRDGASQSRRRRLSRRLPVMQLGSSEESGTARDHRRSPSST